MAMTPEGRVKHHVKKLLTEAKWWFFMPVSNGLGRHGIPDIIACRPTVITPDMVGKTVGLFVGIETKAPGKIGNVSPLQERELTRIKEANGLALVVDDVEQVTPIVCLESLHNMY